MKQIIVFVVLLVLNAKVDAADGQVRLSIENGNALLRVQGKSDDEWRFQISDDLATWTNAPALGTTFSGGNGVRSVAAGSFVTGRRFFRAVKTTGLHDMAVLRTISLAFTQSNWQTLLANGRTTGSNVLCSLVLDNGTTNYGVGARYRGNTSFTGMGPSGSPTKKSLNIEINYTNAEARLMGYKILNINNAYADESIMREPLYFNVMRSYTVCPHSSFVKLYINGAYWGVYCDTQQEDGDLIREYFPSNDGDRWRAPNMGGGQPGGGGPGGGGGFGGGNSALSYLGASAASYKSNYELKSDNSTNAWQRLIHAADVLNNTPASQLRDKVEDVLAVDRWLWFLAIENIFADEDSYYYKGADYSFYYEPESGRIHPVEHDGNESLTPTDASLSPVQGATLTTRPVLKQLLSIPELRQRYLAHMRTVLQESYNPTMMKQRVDQYRALTAAAIATDPKKSYTMTTYTNDLNSILTFVQQRYNFLTYHAELRPLAPIFVAVSSPVTVSPADPIPFINAKVVANGNNGINSVWLYHRGKPYGRFTAVQMMDDGLHGDGQANDGMYGAATTNYSAGAKVRFYVEARSANSAQAASFAPSRAEEKTFSYRVGLTTASNTPVVINELMASNKGTLADPQGEYDDWIELHNITDQEVNLTGHYLSDEPNNPRKWQFPAGARIPANGFLLVWADEDGTATAGFHASFKLDASGEELFLTDTDANSNAVLDHVSFGPQLTDHAYGRLPDNAGQFGFVEPSPGAANK